MHSLFSFETPLSQSALLDIFQNKKPKGIVEAILNEHLWIARSSSCRI
jgi:hypothetical protein